MKQFLFIILLLSLISCRTSDKQIEKGINFRISTINTFQSGSVNYIPSLIKEAYIVENLEIQKSYIYFVLSDIELKRLESQWKKDVKKLKLQKVTLIHEISSYKVENVMTISVLSTDYIIEGEKAEKITEKIYNILETEKAGESMGAINLLYGIRHPDILSYFDFPPLKEKNIFKFEKDDSLITLTNSNSNTTITLTDNGVTRWIGY